MKLNGEKRKGEQMSKHEQPVAIRPSMPEEQPMVPLTGWGRASATSAHLASIDTVAGASRRAAWAAATATRRRTPAASPWT